MMVVHKRIYTLKVQVSTDHGMMDPYYCDEIVQKIRAAVVNCGYGRTLVHLERFEFGPELPNITTSVSPAADNPEPSD